MAAAITQLPPELLFQICTYLSPIDLTLVAKTCSCLYQAANEDRLWRQHVIDSIHMSAIDTRFNPIPKIQWLAHHPYWFIPRHKIWFSDADHYGQLLIARYSRSRRVIEAYALVAERGTMGLDYWHHNRDVIIHKFNPNVRLHLDNPIVRIAAASASNIFPSDARRFQREIDMDNGDTRGPHSLYRTFSLARSLPKAAITEQTAVWPPFKIPSAERVRNKSIDQYRGTGHRPSRLSEISQTAFRTRRWIEFNSPVRWAGPQMRAGEEVHTYATLDPALYTPTKEKPWRGIWVGDYSGHGCEFLVIMQPDEAVELPKAVRDMFAKRQRRRRASSGSAASWQTAPDEILAENVAEDTTRGWMIEDPSTEWMGLADELSGYETDSSAQHDQAPQTDTETGDAEIQFSGQLLGLKLTGDPNVPRGEYTFIAPDTGPQGTIRIAQEEGFRGARVIRSCGHIAGANYNDGESLLKFRLQLQIDGNLNSRFCRYLHP